MVPAPNTAQVKWLNAQLTEMAAEATPLRMHRDKRLAHNDLSHSLKSVGKLPGVSRKAVERSLGLMRETMDGIKAWQASIATDYPALLSGDADSLIFYLQQAKRHTANCRTTTILVASLPTRSFLSCGCRQLPPI